MAYNVYDEIKLESWQSVLDEYLNYHTGEDGPSGNSFKNTVLNMIPFLEGSKKILDVGCGFGGPSRIIAEEFPDVEIIGITNSKVHYDYLKENPIPNFKVHYGDILDWDSEEYFDTAFFLQSFSHMSDDALKVFNAEKIVMNDHISLSRGPVNLKAFNFMARTERGFYNAFSRAGFEISKLESYVSNDSSFDVWGPLIEQLPEEEKIGQLRFLLAFYYSVILEEEHHPYLDVFEKETFEPPFEFNSVRIVAEKLP